MMTTVCFVCQSCFNQEEAQGPQARCSPPKPGDLCMCYSCGTVSVYRGDLSLREISEREMQRLQRQAPFIYRTIQTTLEVVKKRIANN